MHEKIDKSANNSKTVFARVNESTFNNIEKFATSRYFSMSQAVRYMLESYIKSNDISKF